MKRNTKIAMARGDTALEGIVTADETRPALSSMCKQPNPQRIIYTMSLLFFNTDFWVVL